MGESSVGATGDAPLSEESRSSDFPYTFVDQQDRSITLRPYRASDFDALVDMYVDFDPAERAQGLPPLTEYQIEIWLDSFVSARPDVLACHENRPIGHASLVPDDDRHELAIFVMPDYQMAGIGSRLLRTLLERGRAVGVERVWLTVERRNVAALNLYRSTGFEVAESEGRSGLGDDVLVMTRSLSG